MGRVYDVIDNATRQWLAKQPVFFVATAPNDPDGHVNLSPKGGAGAFRVLGPTRVAYVDLVGSGVETVAHLRENGRIVLMFCAFAGPPKIVRLHGQGRVVPNDDPEFVTLLPEFSLDDDARALARGIVVVEAMDGATNDAVPTARPRTKRAMISCVGSWAAADPSAPMT